jgi:hypothetical protein
MVMRVGHRVKKQISGYVSENFSGKQHCSIETKSLGKMPSGTLCIRISNEAG